MLKLTTLCATTLSNAQMIEDLAPAALIPSTSGGIPTSKHDQSEMRGIGEPHVLDGPRAGHIRSQRFGEAEKPICKNQIYGPDRASCTYALSDRAFFVHRHAASKVVRSVEVPKEPRHPTERKPTPINVDHVCGDFCILNALSKKQRARIVIPEVLLGHFVKAKGDPCEAHHPSGPIREAQGFGGTTRTSHQWSCWQVPDLSGAATCIMPEPPARGLGGTLVRNMTCVRLRCGPMAPKLATYAIATDCALTPVTMFRLAGREPGSRTARQVSIGLISPKAQACAPGFSQGGGLCPTLSLGRCALVARA